MQLFLSTSILALFAGMAMAQGGSLDPITLTYPSGGGQGGASAARPTSTQLAFGVPGGTPLYGYDSGQLDATLGIDASNATWSMLGAGLGTQAGMAFDETTGTLFTTDSGTRLLYSVNLGNGNLTQLGFLGVDLPHGAAVDPQTGVLYVASDVGTDTLLYTASKTNGVTTLVGSMGQTHIGALDFDPITGVLWGAYGYAEATGQLFTIDTSTGLATPGPVTTRLNSIAFDNIGQMYGTDNQLDSTSDTLFYSIDHFTGTATLIAPLAGATNVLGMDFRSAPGFASCFGDGSSGFDCPCANLGASQRGCAHSANNLGGRLDSTGVAQPGGLSLNATGLVPLQPALYFQANNVLNGGLGVIFGDGLRCIGGSVQRLEVQSSSAVGSSQSSVDVFAAGGVSLGELRHYQVWFRDPVGSPCGSGFNLTNAQTIQW